MVYNAAYGQNYAELETVRSKINAVDTKAMMQYILIIEDEADIAESLHYNFKREGFRPKIAESGEKGLRLALDEKNSPSLILLDLMLPGMSGMELCRRLCRELSTKKIPIIMLTAKAAETDKIAGLELGADDYIVKPFSVKEVVARVRAVLRRVEDETIQKYEDDKISIDFSDMRVSCGGPDVKLTRKEFALLTHLARLHGGEVSVTSTLSKGSTFTIKLPKKLI